MTRRLKVLAELCPKDAPLADIGADHGYLAQVLLQAGFSHPLFATELSDASFQSLKVSLMDTTVTLYQADGLTNLPRVVKTVVIAGMGGRLIIDILTKNLAIMEQINTLVLGPQRDSHLLRAWLINHGWRIEKEAFVFEDNQGYPLMVAVAGTMALSMIEAWYGPWLIKHPNLDYLLWLSHEAKHLSKSIAFKDNQDRRLRLEWIVNYVKNHDIT
jgi:tRNA (adenine22-N1)-methyltransferase